MALPRTAAGVETRPVRAPPMQERARAPADQALRRGRAPARSGAAPLGAAAILALQRAAGNEAINALMLGQLRMPGPQAAREMAEARTELHRDEPVVDKVEKGLKAARALGIPVDLEGIKPPASALAVTSSGFGPGAVAAKKPVPPPKRTPPVSPLGKAAAKGGDDEDDEADAEGGEVEGAQ